MAVVSRMALRSYKPVWRAVSHTLPGTNVITLPCISQRHLTTTPGAAGVGSVKSCDTSAKGLRDTMTLSSQRALRRGNSTRPLQRPTTPEMASTIDNLSMDILDALTEGQPTCLTPSTVNSSNNNSNEIKVSEDDGAAIADASLAQFMSNEMSQLDTAVTQEEKDTLDSDSSSNVFTRHARHGSSSRKKPKKAADTPTLRRTSTKKKATENTVSDTPVKVKPDAEPEISVLLTPEQQHAVELALQGRNLFITGSAGTGKSVVVHEITRQLRARGRNVYLTATTGVAALNIRGATINSFAGTGFAHNMTPVDALKVVRRNRRACGRWKYCSTLIIDEISMLTPHYLDVLDYVAKMLRKRPDEPFGGVQVILCGDFLQLPPVTRPRERYAMYTAVLETSSLDALNMQDSTRLTDQTDDGAMTSTTSVTRLSYTQQPEEEIKKYCFESPTWATLGLSIVVLHRKHRQGKDIAFQSVLDDIRVGALSKTSYELLAARVMACDDDEQERNTRHGAQMPTDTTTATMDNSSNNTREHYVRLCGTNREVNERNARFFARLAPKTDVYNFCRVISPTNTSLSTKVKQSSVHHEDTASDMQWPLHVYDAYDAYLSPTSRPGEYIEEPVMLATTTTAPLHKSIFSVTKGNQSHRTQNEKSNTSAASQDGSWVRFDDSPLATRLPLKIGTRVMLLHNVSTRYGLVNGSVGEVAGFLHPLELVDLVLRAGRERHAPTPRGAELLARGGFTSFRDVFRCMDTSHANQPLYYWLRHYLPDRRDVHVVSYADVFGELHLRDLRRLTGCDVAEETKPNAEVQSSVADKASSVADESTLSFLDELLASPANNNNTNTQSTSRNTTVYARPVHAADLYLGGLQPEQLLQMRLPVVRIDRPKRLLSLDEQQQEEEKNDTEANSLAASTATSDVDDDSVSSSSNERKLLQQKKPTNTTAPSHVYAFVSPYRQYWYMGSRAVASRLQLPLRHAWAMTVHKSQGLTIQQLEIDMSCYNTPGQTYVALSRATGLQDLRLLNLRPECILACPVARAFYGSLESTP